MTSTFTYVPSYTAQADRAPRTKNAQFGDGYEQRAPDGLNPLTDAWQLQFNNRITSEMTALDAFLIACGGVTYFLWTPPNGAQAKYICRKWSRVLNNGNIESLTATFEQVFDNT